MKRAADITLFESLQKEFCPTLDSSLIAALLFEVESDVDGNSIIPTSDQIEGLRTTFQELSLQADRCSGIEYFSDVDSTFREQTTSSWTGFINDEKSSTNSGSSSSSSSTSFASHLGFLQTVLPDVPSVKLKKALEIHDGEDLWDIIAVIVAEEAIRETEERGLGGDQDDETGWQVIQRKGEETDTIKVLKKKTPKKPVKIVLADVRQQHHAQNTERKNGLLAGISSYQPAPSTVDPWTRISSLSSRLASLLPPHPSTTFSSFLHSPQYTTSYDAVRACLKSLCKSNDLSDQQATLLINLLDVIIPEDDEPDITTRSEIIADIELSVCVTEGRADDALDLANLLRDLHSPTGVGLNSFRSHLSSSTLHSQGSSLTSTAYNPPPPQPYIRSETHPRASLKNDTHKWKTVPSRPKSNSVSSLPTYSRDVNGNKTARSRFANHVLTSSASAEADTSDSRLRMRQARTKSRQALMDAAIMYQKRNSRNYGGAVALFYAERAREWKGIAEREALNAARELVLAKRNGNRDDIDLHGTTVTEALVIVREILNQRADSITPGKPLRLITGKGKHSAGRVSVLKSTLHGALTRDGWLVTSWDAGLIIHGVLV